MADERLIEVIEADELKQGLKEFGADLVEQLSRAAPAPAVQSDRLSQLLELLLAEKAEEVQKRSDEKIRKEQARQDMVKTAREYEALVQASQDNCSHTKENGRTAISGQVHNDRKFHPFCQRCFKAFTPVDPTPEQMPRGMQMV